LQTVTNALSWAGSVEAGYCSGYTLTSFDGAAKTNYVGFYEMKWPGYKPPGMP